MYDQYHFEQYGNFDALVRNFQVSGFTVSWMPVRIVVMQGVLDACEPYI